jgi:tRNA-specific 2-thiouridylase
LESGEVQLLRGLDPAKDQSYFLHRLTQDQLQRVIFPVGELRKTEVRRIAAEIGLPNARKKDSTGICFIGERPFRAFLNQYLPTQPGPVVTTEGLEVGRHQGLAFYTLGQRKGLGIGGIKKKGFQSAEGQGWFVARKDLSTNTLVVTQDHDHPLLMAKGLSTTDACWVSGRAPPPGQALGLKTRYRQPDASGRFLGAKGSGFEVAFGSPQWAVTPGQSVVAYDGDVCLGGGIIERATGVT